MLNIKPSNPFFYDKRGNCTLNKKVATELVKELGKIWSFTHVFQKKICHHSTGKELMILGKMCSQCGQEDLVKTVWFDDVRSNR